MKYDPRIHHRRSIRLQGYDYSQPSAYFITACTHDRALLLSNESVQEVVQSTWDRLPDRFPTLSLDEFVIMPDHVHGILIFTEPDCDSHSLALPRPTLGSVVGAFKSISAIAANRVLGRSSVPFWQRNYYEHVIRNEEKLNQIRQYILDNPAKWADDPNNPKNVAQQIPSAQRGVIPRAGVGAGQAHAPTG